MATSSIFSSAARRLQPATTVNAAGGPAYVLEAKEALARYAVTNTFGGTFYASAASQLQELQGLIAEVDDEFVAALAVYARKEAHMKDMAAFLLATLAARSSALLKTTFPLVADNAKMVKNFVQILRSGVTGRRSLGTAPKRLVQRWLQSRTPQQLLNDSVGGDPTLTDLLRMMHPCPVDATQEALFGRLLGKKVADSALPEIWQALQRFQRGETTEPPAVSFQLLTGKALTSAQWTQIARHASWQATRMNLNTFLRQGVLVQSSLVSLIAARLRDATLIRQARVMPYQLLSAYVSADSTMPREIVSALHDALEVACERVPAWPDKKLVIAVDVSFSMKDPVTGRRGSATSAIRCVDVAALMASALLRKNPTAQVVCFSDKIRDCVLEPRDTVMTNARKMAALAKGGTDCSCAMALIQRDHPDADLVLFISDNESWRQYDRAPSGGATRLAVQWQAYRQRNPKAKLVLLDMTPTVTSQNYTQQHVLNIAGFSDAVFPTIDGFLMHQTQGRGYWAALIHRYYQSTLENTQVPNGVAALALQADDE